MLDADKAAAEGREFYDDEYFAAFGDGATAVLEAARERFDFRGGRRDRRRLGAGRAARTCRPTCREPRADSSSKLGALNVYFIPLGPDRFEALLLRADEARRPDERRGGRAARVLRADARPLLRDG